MPDAETTPAPASREPRGEGRPPLWVRAADAIALTCLVLGVFVLLFGSFLLHLGPLPIRVHSPQRLLFFAAALVAIRHVAHPGVPLHRRLTRGLRDRGEGSVVSLTSRALVSRVSVLIVGYLAVVTVGFDP